jgi:DNA-binding XRE family transcriptional regulator
VQGACRTALEWPGSVRTRNREKLTFAVLILFARWLLPSKVFHLVSLSLRAIEKRSRIRKDIEIFFAYCYTFRNPIGGIFWSYTLSQSAYTQTLETIVFVKKCHHIDRCVNDARRWILLLDFSSWILSESEIKFFSRVPPLVPRWDEWVEISFSLQHTLPSLTFTHSYASVTRVWCVKVKSNRKTKIPIATLLS